MTGPGVYGGRGAVQHHRKIIGGGAIALVLPYPYTGEWIWRYRAGRAIFDRTFPGEIDLPRHTFDAPEQFAEALGLELA